MKKHTMMMLALSVGAASLANAADNKSSDFSLSNRLKESFTLFDAKRDNAENTYIQEFSLKLRGQYQGAWMDPAGGTERLKGADDGHDKRDNNEWRRFRLGAQAKVLNNFTLKGVWNVGGLDSRYKYSNGRWNRSSTSAALDELYLAGSLKEIAYSLGKHKPAYMGEYRTSSAKILTIERSSIVNQLKAEKLYGVSISSKDKKADLQWNTGLWVNGQRDGNTWLEPSFNSEDGYTFGASVSYATGAKSRLYFDYMHSFHNEDDSHPGTEYAGAGAQDVLAVTWETKKDDFSFMAEGIAGLNVYNGGAGAQNVYGLVMMPSYRLSPHWEAVARYQLAGGSNAVVSDSRYYTTNSDYAKNCDLQQGFYFGANYYVCPDNPHQMKLMFGAEYLNSHGKDAKGNKGYTGWQISAGARFDF